jgi:hypothetical protein
MNNTGPRPIGDSTTVLDLADRDEMDDDLFPLTATKSWFTRDPERRYLNFSTTIQEFTPKGSTEFGGYLVFELGAVKACDLLLSVALQIRLNHWFPPSIVEKIQNGSLTYADPSQAWYYANSLGTCLIAKAEFLLEDQVLETVDGNFSNVFSVVYSDINTQFGVGVDGNGRVTIPQLLTWSETRVFPTSNGFISCILPFSFQRIRLRNGLPLLSCKDGTVRIAITLRPFSECVRIASGIRETCNDTPLGKSFTFNVTGGGTQTIVASTTVPQFADARLVTYGMLLDGKLRKAAVHAPFERIFREVQTFQFSEPQKYVVNVPSNGVVRLQLPLEINGPIEELFWFIRRKAVSVNNEWVNYSNRLQSEYDPVTGPLQSMLQHAVLQVDGTPFIDAPGDFFRRDVAKRHKGGIVAYNAFVYGYSFAQNPGFQNPSGWMNASRSSDIRLRLDIQPPEGTETLEFEVFVYSIAFNWVRFENGIANKVFSS